MAIDLKPEEVSAILKKQLAEFGMDSTAYEVGTVLSVGDGIARVHGLSNVMAGELVEFPGGLIGLVISLAVLSLGSFFTLRRATRLSLTHMDQDNHRLGSLLRVSGALAGAEYGHIAAGIADLNRVRSERNRGEIRARAHDGPSGLHPRSQRFRYTSRGSRVRRARGVGGLRVGGQDAHRARLYGHQRGASGSARPRRQW